MWLSAVGFIVTLTLSMLAAPLAADAQQPKRIPRIGGLWLGSSTGPLPNQEAFRQGLRELGYVEGQNMILEERFAEGKPDRLPALAAELAGLNVDVIVTAGEAAMRATVQASRTIPIVAAFAGDLVEIGLATSLARPGGNLTGLTTLAPELVGKRLELLKELIPGLSRVGVLWNPQERVMALEIEQAKVAAQVLGVQLQFLEVRDPNDLERAFEAATGGRAEALLVSTTFFFARYQARIVQLAAKSQLPTMSGNPEFVRAGGLMAYGPSRPDMFRRAATYVHKILLGAKPGDLPVEQAMHFELVINLKTAEALGLTLPPHILVFANEVIR